MYEDAIAELKIHAENCQANAQVFAGEGNFSEAQCAADNAKGYLAAVAILEYGKDDSDSWQDDDSIDENGMTAFERYHLKRYGYC